MARPVDHERRQDLLDAAIDYVSEHGISELSLRPLAAAVGTQAPVLLHHFGSKDQLLTELLAHRDASEIAEVNDPERPHGTAFLDHLTLTAERNSQRRGLTQLYVVLSADGVTDDHPAQAYFRSRYDGLRSMIAEEIRLAQAGGDVAKSIDPAETATLVIAAMDGLQIQWLYNPEAVDMTSLVRKLITVLTTA
jgi:AcrR family transcriptional regulator